MQSKAQIISKCKALRYQYYTKKVFDNLHSAHGKSDINM